MFEPPLAVNPSQVHPALASVVAEMAGRVVRGGTAAASDLQVRSLLALSRQVDALLLAQIAAFDDQGFAFACGAKSTGSYLAAHGHLDHGAARRLVVAARTADRLPQLGEMLSAGDIGVDHVAAVGFSTQRLPGELVTSEDSTLASLASSARPSELRTAGKHLQAMYDTDAVSKDANHVRESRYLTMAQTFGGAWHLEGSLPPEDGVAISLVLDSLSGKAGAEDNRTATQRRADALSEMAALALRCGELPDTGGDQPRISLLVQATTDPFAHRNDDDAGDALDDCGLAHQQGGGHRHSVQIPGQRRARSGWAQDTRFSATAFALTDVQLLASAAMMSVETFQRICCDAEFNVATYDATGNIMNMGRTTRDPTLAQRRAVRIRDKHCVFPGCDTPPHRCQVHHVHFWSNGGCTDLCNLALVCAFHHQLVHEHHWTLALASPTPDHPHGGWIATAPDGSPYRQWRRQAA